MIKEIISLNDVLGTYNSQPSTTKIESLRCKFTALADSKRLPEYAYLVGKIMGDGHLSHSYNLHFVSGSKKDLEELTKFISKNFNISTQKMYLTIRQQNGINYSLRINHAFFGRIVYCLGAPKGNKVKQSFFVPTWIYSNKLFKKRFLMAILEDELCTIKIARKNHSIKPRLKMAKEELFIDNLRFFLQQVKEGIESFGVQCSEVSKRPNSKLDQSTKELYFDIFRNKRNIIKFEDEIGFFLNKDKKIKLKECCDILRSTLRPEVNKEEIFALRNKGLSIREIAKRISHNKMTVFRVLQQQQYPTKKT